MCRGYYGQPQGEEEVEVKPNSLSNRDLPLIDGGLYYPPASSQFHDTIFIVDSGAYVTCLRQSTAISAGITQDMYDRPIDLGGFSGRGEAYVVEGEVYLSFRESSPDSGDIRHVEELERIVVAPSLQTEADLLGRDIIDRFDANLDRYNDRIQMDRQDFAGGSYYVEPLD